MLGWEQYCFEYVKLQQKGTNSGDTKPMEIRRRREANGRTIRATAGSTGCEIKHSACGRERKCSTCYDA